MRINDATLLQQVVNYLDRHQDTVRIKKMLYCLCTSRWEKDADYLHSIQFQYLIEQIIKEQPSLERFRSLLQNTIATINKPKRYIEVAKVIYLAIGQLYPEFNREHGHNGGRATATAPAHTPEPTQAATNMDVPSTLQRMYAPEPTQAATNMDVPSTLQRMYAPEPTQATIAREIPAAVAHAYEPAATHHFESQTAIDPEVDESAYETYYNPNYDPEMDGSNYGEAQYGETQYGETQYAETHYSETYYSPEDEYSAQADYQPQVPEYDSYVLRQNVMSYANPLRAKIILLLMLRPNFNFSSQSASTMREYLLDDLLLEVLTTYPTLSQFEESMNSAVEQLVEIEEYGKTANGLIQSLVPLYTKMQGGR
jgi:hypothetical protein